MLITWLLLRGARESSTANNIMVIVKLAVLALFIVAGLTHINTAYYTPFAPNGFTGIHQGAAIVFFAYIGFDAISTAAEETKNPQRNLPIGILGGLAICTVIYIIIGAVLTGMVPYTELGKAADPLAYALNATGLQGIAKIVALGAVFSMAAVLLVFQYGQPRIFFAMARDGLMFERIGAVHPRFRTPYMAIMLNAALGVAFVLLRTFEQLADAFVTAIVPFYALAVASVFMLRRRADWSPAYRVPGYPVVPALFILAVAYLLVSSLLEPSSRWPTIAVMAVTLAGIPVYKIAVDRTGGARPSPP
jgi:APA family basic amino acid/polyamine antiporter